MKILLAAGGSGGHVNPCLSLYYALKNKGHKPFVLCTPSSYEEKRYINEGIPHIMVNIRNQMRKNLWPLQNIFTFFKEVKRIQKEYRFEVLFGFGGFLTIFLFVLALFSKTRLYFHEQNCVLGDSNIIASTIAKKAFLSFPLSRNNLMYKSKMMIVGNPREDVRVSYRQKENVNIGFLSGSLGSSTLNKIYFETIKALPLNYNIYLFSNEKNILVQDNVYIINKATEIKETLGKCTLVVTRAGGTSLAELRALEIPSIIVPSPNVKHHHQHKNASYFSSHGMGIMIEEKGLSSTKLKSLIEKMINDRILIVKMKSKLIQNKQVNVNNKIIEQIEHDYARI